MSFLSPEFSLSSKAARLWESGVRDVDWVGRNCFSIDFFLRTGVKPT
jgi:hypothetical protein